MDGRSTCLNCGSTLTGRWCAVCGQDGDRRLRSLPGLLFPAIQTVADVDGPTVSTLRTLFRHPGRATREYAQGHFVGQVDPLRLYLAISALYFFLAPRLGGGFIRLAGGSGSSGAWFSFGPLGWDSAFLLLVLVPLWALAARVIIAERERYFEECFVFSVHYQVVFFLVVVVAGVLAALCVRAGAPALAPPLLLAALGVLFIHLLQALRTAFGLAGIRLLMSTVALFLLHLGGAQLLQNRM